MMPESRLRPIAILLILIAAFAIYGVILLPGHTFAGMDFHNLSYPRVAVAKEAAWSGRIPLWNWHEWGGAPLLAALTGAVLYPPVWTMLGLPLPYGLQLFVFAHLLFAGGGTYLLGRRVFRITPGAAAFSAVAYMGNAFFIGRIEQFQIVAVNCLLPWLFLTGWFAITRRHAGAGLAITWAMMLLAGHPQFAVLGFLGTAIFIGTALLLHSRFGELRWRMFISKTLRAAGWMTIGTAGAAAQLLPSWELGRLSERIWPYPDPTTPELSWSHLLALVVPRYYNIITNHPGVVLDYTELGMYAGILTVPLALTGLVLSLRRKRPSAPAGVLRRRTLTISAALVWLLAMIMALGKHGFIAPFVYDHLPFFSQSRGAVRSLNVASLMLAIMAGVGVHSLGIALQQINAPKRQNPAITPAILALLLTVLTTIDLAYNHFEGLKLNLVSTAHASTKALVPGEVDAEIHASGSRIYRFMAFDSDLYLNNTPQAVAERNARLQPNFSSVQGHYLTDGYEEGLLPMRNHANLHRKYNRNLRDTSPDAGLLALLGAHFMLTEYEIAPNPAYWEQVSQPYPRTAVVPALQPGMVPTYTWWKSKYPPGAILSVDVLARKINLDDALQQAQHDFPLADQVRVPPGRTTLDHAFSHLAPSLYAEAAEPFSTADPFHWNSISVQLERPTSAALLLQAPYPGWKVSEKNAIRAKIKPLNSIMYGVEFENQINVSTPVVFNFSPFSFRLGLFISLFAFGMLLSYLVGRTTSTKRT